MDTKLDPKTDTKPAPEKKPAADPKAAAARPAPSQATDEKDKGGRPKGAKDAPDTPRQLGKRERLIREENEKRDRELLKKAKQDPSLVEWVDKKPEELAPMYDFAHASIVSFAGLSGLSQKPEVKATWCKAAADFENFYQLDLLAHPALNLAVATFIAAGPSIAADALRALATLAGDVE